MEDGVHIVSGPTGRTAYVIGRFSPPHKGHILFLLWLLERSDRVIIGIGSCYESGVSRHPLLAVFREKMLLSSLMGYGIDTSRIAFVHLQDSPGDFRWWWDHVTSFPGFGRVTDFVTGNEQEILAQLDRHGLRPEGLSFINPEKDLPSKYHFPYHATDLRKAIAANDYAMFERVAASGTMSLMGNFGGFEMIREALDDVGERFVPGRQTVDVVVLCRSPRGRGRMVLCGRRQRVGKDGREKDFAGRLAIPGGAIDPYESPLDAAVRELGEETGLPVTVVARHLEPAHVLIGGHIATMRFVKLFSSSDPALAGTKGGSSQVFCIDLDLRADELVPHLRSDSDLEDVAFRPLGTVLKEGLAYQQTDMVKAAIRR